SHTYALRAGTFAGRGNVRSGAEPVGRGTLGYMTNATIRGLADGVYYWSVQAVDNGLARSEWAPEQSFVIDTKPPRVTRLRGDTLSVGLDRVINVAIDFDDALTGVDTLSAIDVTLSLVGQPPFRSPSSGGTRATSGSGKHQFRPAVSCLSRSGCASGTYVIFAVTSSPIPPSLPGSSSRQHSASRGRRAVRSRTRQEP
ncbi:MAG TPA: hypothetical protein P5179_13845, partial [Candidatus Latescibacteria bacterium]|nr:hypothetical protein [Candidatus Latescibacterota bacterium]